MPTTKTVHSLVIDGRSADNNNRVVVGCGFIKNGGAAVNRKWLFDCQLSSGTSETYDLCMEQPTTDLVNHDVYVAMKWRGAVWHDKIGRQTIMDNDLGRSRLITELLYGFSFVIAAAFRDGMTGVGTFDELAFRFEWISPTELGVRVIPVLDAWFNDDGEETIDIDAFVESLPVEPFAIIAPNVAS